MNESIESIVTEMRERADAMQTHGTTHGVRLAVLEFARRIEAAWKREKAEAESNALSVGGIVEAARHKPVGNAAAMREALEDSQSLLESFSFGEYGEQIRAQMQDNQVALAAPTRNCDAGTAEEQAVRFDAFVRDRRVDLNCTEKCPAHNGVDYGVVNCVLQWAQMPYEAQEGGEK